MFALESIFSKSKTKYAVLVTIVVALTACSSGQRKMVDEGEVRVIPQSALAPGESWGDAEQPISYASTKQDFRSRVKKSAKKSRKSQVASRK